MEKRKCSKDKITDVATQIRKQLSATAEQLARVLKGTNRYELEDIMWILKQQKVYVPTDVFRTCRLQDHTLDEIVAAAVTKEIEYSLENIVFGTLDDSEAHYALPTGVQTVRKHGFADDQIATVFKKRTELSSREVMQSFFDAGATVPQIITAFTRAGDYSPSEILTTMKDVCDDLAEAIKAFLEAGQRPEAVGALLRQIECTAREIGACYKGKENKLDELLAILSRHYPQEEIGAALAAANLLVELDASEATEEIDDKGTPALENMRTLPRPTLVTGTVPPPPAPKKTAIAS